jgi:hypothetical protein
MYVSLGAQTYTVLINNILLNLIYFPDHKKTQNTRLRLEACPEGEHALGDKSTAGLAVLCLSTKSGADTGGTGAAA